MLRKIFERDRPKSASLIDQNPQMLPSANGVQQQFSLSPSDGSNPMVHIFADLKNDDNFNDWQSRHQFATFADRQPMTLPTFSYDDVMTQILGADRTRLASFVERSRRIPSSADSGGQSFSLPTSDGSIATASSFKNDDDFDAGWQRRRESSASTDRRPMTLSTVPYDNDVVTPNRMLSGSLIDRSRQTPPSADSDGQSFSFPTSDGWIPTMPIFDDFFNNDKFDGDSQCQHVSTSVDRQPNRQNFLLPQSDGSIPTMFDFFNNNGNFDADPQRQQSSTWQQKSWSLFSDVDDAARPISGQSRQMLTIANSGGQSFSTLTSDGGSMPTASGLTDFNNNNNNNGYNSDVDQQPSWFTDWRPTNPAIAFLKDEAAMFASLAPFEVDTVRGPPSESVSNASFLSPTSPFVDFQTLQQLDPDAYYIAPPRRKKGPIKPSPVCVFCRNNGESPAVYKSHVTKDPLTRKTVCPKLVALPPCRYCGKYGAEGHTERHCQIKPPVLLPKMKASRI